MAQPSSSSRKNAPWKWLPSNSKFTIDQELVVPLPPVGPSLSSSQPATNNMNEKLMAVMTANTNNLVKPLEFNVSLPPNMGLSITIGSN